jgi:hypothetical protein
MLALQRRGGPADSAGVSSARPAAACLRTAFLVALALAASACVAMPSRGTPVLVDHRAGRFWSGKGMLLEVSEDQRSCRVAVRDRSLVFVRTLWTSCDHVHSASTRD